MKIRWKLVVMVGIAVSRVVITLTCLLTSKISLHDQGLAPRRSVHWIRSMTMNLQKLHMWQPYEEGGKYGCEINVRNSRTMRREKRTSRYYSEGREPYASIWIWALPLFSSLYHLSLAIPTQTIWSCAERSSLLRSQLRKGHQVRVLTFCDVLDAGVGL